MYFEDLTPDGVAMKSYRTLDVTPTELLCLVCRAGARQLPPRLAGLWRSIRNDVNVPLRLRCRTESVYAFQGPRRLPAVPGGHLTAAKRDLDILQQLALVPGDARPAWELFARLLQKTEGPATLCAGGQGTSAAWRGCSRAPRSAFECVKAAGVKNFLPVRPAEEKARAKLDSVRDIYHARVLGVRPHHLMCLACFHGGRQQLGPIAEDNLFEVIDLMHLKPRVPVMLVSGCCMICPPCSDYDPATRLCVRNNARSLRDEKKDLDVLHRLGLAYGDTLPARDLFRRLFREIRSTTEVCGYGDGIMRAWEWTICGAGPRGNEAYRKARACGMGLVSRGRGR